MAHKTRMNSLLPQEFNLLFLSKITVPINEIDKFVTFKSCKCDIDSHKYLKNSKIIVFQMNKITLSTKLMSKLISKISDLTLIKGFVSIKNINVPIFLYKKVIC